MSYYFNKTFEAPFEEAVDPLVSMAAVKNEDLGAVVFDIWPGSSIIKVRFLRAGQSMDERRISG